MDDIKDPSQRKQVEFSDFWQTVIEHMSRLHPNSACRFWLGSCVVAFIGETEVAVLAETYKRLFIMNEYVVEINQICSQLLGREVELVLIDDGSESFISKPGDAPLPEDAEYHGSTVLINADVPLPERIYNDDDDNSLAGIFGITDDGAKSGKTDAPPHANGGADAVPETPTDAEAAPPPKSEHAQALEKRLARLPKRNGQVDPTSLFPSGEGMINPDYTFENFIVGDSNRFAHAACTAVAGQTTQTYNPLFIYGDSGLGKTHLMYATANAILAREPKPCVIFVRGEDFTNELILCISNKTTVEFREKYRKADALFIDDVQFIAGKDATQEEFFHTFNELYQSHKQIVLASDRPPREMKTLENRIRSRFEWGLLCDVQHPDYELRRAILTSKAEQLGLKLHPDAVTFIIEHITDNIRQLEGAVKKLKALSLLNGSEFTRDFVASSLSEFTRKELTPQIYAQAVLSAVAAKYELTTDAILSKSRQDNIKTARNVAVYILRRISNLSYPDIGGIIGRDHTTIINSYKNIDAAVKKNTQLRSDIDDLEAEIKRQL